MYEMKIEKPQVGYRRWFKAIKYSYAGILAAWRNEAAFREELILICFLIPLALMMGKTNLERACLIGSVLFVLIVELLNSAIEAIVDLVSPDFHVLAGRAKDLGSAAVFLSLVLVFTVWGFILS
jgi:diacylglycerol kinase (ATP)